MYLFPYEYFPFELRSEAMLLLPAFVRALKWQAKFLPYYPDAAKDFDMFREIFCYRSLLKVSRAKSKNTTQSSERAPQDKRDVVWVNLRIQEADEAWITEYLPDESTTAAAFLALAQMSVNIYVRFIPSQGTFTAGLIAEHPTQKDKLVGISGWSDDLLDAIRALACKWYSVLGGTWVNLPDTKPSKYR